MQDALRSLRAAFGFPAREVEARLLGRRRPLLAGYKLTYRCNLQCRHCPFWQLQSPDPDFSAARSVVDELYRRGVRILILEGGEPLLWRDGEAGLSDLIGYAQERFWSVGVVTNGTLPLPEEPDVLWVSVDGLEVTTRRIRGPIYHRQMAELAASTHPRLFANITVSALNVSEIPALAETLASRVKGITIQFYYPYQGEDDLVVPFDQRAALLDRLLAMKAGGYPLLDSRKALRQLREPGWRCHSWLVANADPDGTIHQGCYLKGRGPVACRHCGFAAHLEMSLAYDLDPGALLAGLRIFGLLSNRPTGVGGICTAKK